jgi:hypothetical protein
MTTVKLSHVCEQRLAADQERAYSHVRNGENARFGARCYVSARAGTVAFAQYAT